MNDPTASDGQRRRGVFDVDEDKALDALDLAWGEQYEIWIDDGTWGAHRKGTPDSDAVTAATPDQLHANLQADAARRSTV